jgi:hypothetical protein
MGRGVRRHSVNPLLMIDDGQRLLLWRNLNLRDHLQQPRKAVPMEPY